MPQTRDFENDLCDGFDCYEENDFLADDFDFLSLGEEGAIYPWGAVDDEWSHVPPSYGPAGIICISPRTVLFRMNYIEKGHADLFTLRGLVIKWMEGM